MLDREFAQAFRSLSRAPGWSAICLATFALVVGAAAGIFGAADAVLLRPLPYPEAKSVLFIGEQSAQGEGGPSVTSALVLNTLRENPQTLEDVAIFNIMQAVLTDVGEPTLYAGGAVSWNYFRALRRSAAIGRTFEEADAEGAPARVVISDALWRQRFNSDRAAIRRIITLSGIQHEIIGVMPPDFHSPDDYIFGARPADIWRAVNYTSSRPGSRYLRGVARIRPGLTMAQVDAELDAVRARIGEQFSEWAESNRIVALRLQDHVTNEARPVLMLLVAAAVLVLLIGCANLANMVLARGLGRTREAGVRAALGAGRTAAVRPLFLEVIVLGVLGAVGGILLAIVALEILVRTAPAHLPRVDAIGIDIRVVLAAFVMALAVACIASLFPVLRLRPSSADAGILAGRLRGGTAGRGHHRAQAAFAVAQMALALAVLAGATVLARSFYKLMRVHPGYEPERLFATQIDLPQTRYADGQTMVRFTQQVAATMQAAPDVEAVSFVTTLPQHGLNNFSMGVSVSGRPVDAQPVSAHYRGVGARYFETAGIPLLSGRYFEPRDFTVTPTAAIVNEEFSRRFFPNSTPLNQFVEDSIQIVGVVGSVKYAWRGADAEPEIYVPYYGEASTVFLVARARPAASVTAAIRSAVHAADPLIPVDVLSSEQLLMNSTAEQRFALLLVLALAAIAVALAAVGLYGVISYAVTERAREFAIRVALGLPAPEIVGLVLRRGIRIALAGSIIGVALAVNGSRLLQGLLFNVSPRDPVLLAGATVVLILFALFAAWWPARRASYVDPAMALRNE